MLELRFPLHIEIKITNACNLRCIHCISDAGEKSINELSTQEIFKIIDEAKKNGAFSIGLTGGEPFCRKDIFEIIDYIHKKKLNLVLTTNGTLLNEHIIEKIKTKISLMRISLDHCVPEKHDYFRGMKGAFKKTLSTLYLLRRYRKYFQTTVLTVISKFNFYNFKEIVNYFKKVDIEAANFFLFAPFGRGEKNREKLELTKNHAKEFCKMIKILIKKEKKIKIHTNNPLMALVEKYKLPRICPAAITSCFITETGRVIPCPYFYSLPNFDDNIQYSSVKKIWNESFFFKILRDESYLASECQQCKKKFTCFGGCRAAAFNEFGTILKPDPLCWIVK